MRNIYAYLLSAVWFAVPVSAWSGTMPQPRELWTDRYTADQSWFEQDPLIHAVVEPWYERFPTYTHLGKKERKDEPTRGSEQDTGLSDKDTGAYGNFLGPSFDGVNGHSRSADPWWGRKPEGDPMIRELSREPLRDRPY